jgi:hypothetical protein
MNKDYRKILQAALPYSTGTEISCWQTNYSRQIDGCCGFEHIAVGAYKLLTYIVHSPYESYTVYLPRMK